MDKIFKPKISKDNSNEKVYYSFIKDNKKIKNSEIEPSDFISNLDKDGSYIFSKEVIIETKNDIYDTKIAGKKNDKIITIDSRIIPIKDILKIYYK